MRPCGQPCGSNVGRPAEPLLHASHSCTLQAWCIAYKPLVLRCRNSCIANQIAGFCHVTFSAYASRCSKFFGVVRADFLAAYCPVEETRSFSVLDTKPFSRGYRGFSGTELKIQHFSVQLLKKKPLSALRRRQSPSWHWNRRYRVFPSA